MLLDFARQFVEDVLHLRAVVAVQDDDHVIVGAEFVGVLPPALEIIFFAADKIVALGEAGEVLEGVNSASGAREHDADEDKPRMSADESDHGGQRAPSKPASS